MTGKMDWKTREGQRLASGKYKAVPWIGEAWVAKEGPLAEHFVHVSERDPYMLAYTPSASDGERDRRVPIKPGRYLQKFYADKLSAEQVKHYASMVRGSGLRIEYTDKADVMRAIYASGGLTACMSYGVNHYGACRYNGGKHPIEAYIGGDLKLAYSKGPSGGITARALVWPERKIFSRCYGDHEALKKALEAEGFAQGLLDGAALAVIPLDAREFQKPTCGMPYLTAPYVDHVKWACYDPKAKTFKLQVKATGATHSVQHGDGIGYPISIAPQRPAGQTGISIAAEHAQLVAIEAGKTPDSAKPDAKAAQQAALYRAALNPGAGVAQHFRVDYNIHYGNQQQMQNQAVAPQQGLVNGLGQAVGIEIEALMRDGFDAIRGR